MSSLTDIVMEDDRWALVDLGRIADRAAHQTLDHLQILTDGYEIAILGCDDARIADLNADFREKPTPTNVLSWPAHELFADDDGDAPDQPPNADPLMGEALGDIAISYDTCLREADSAGKAFEHHVTHLVVHGVLHLLGYDHVRDGDATLMERTETEILGKMGLPDPYRDYSGR